MPWKEEARPLLLAKESRHLRPFPWKVLSEFLLQPLSLFPSQMACFKGAPLEMPMCIFFHRITIEKLFVKLIILSSQDTRCAAVSQVFAL